MINSGVETPISSLEGNTPSRNFSTPLDLAHSFGQPVDVAEVVHDPKIAEARKNQEASKVAIYGLFQEVYGPFSLHCIFTGMADHDANALLLRILNFPKNLQSLLADYETKLQRFISVVPRRAVGTTRSQHNLTKVVGSD